MKPTHVIITQDAIELPETINGLVGTATDLEDLKLLLITMFKAWVEQEAVRDQPLISSP